LLDALVAGQVGAQGEEDADEIEKEGAGGKSRFKIYPILSR